MVGGGYRLGPRGHFDDSLQPGFARGALERLVSGVKIA
jgi:hypothetical protein